MEKPRKKTSSNDKMSEFILSDWLLVGRQGLALHYFFRDPNFTYANATHHHVTFQSDFDDANFTK